MATTATAIDDIEDQLEAEVAQLKRDRNAVILAHYYQDSEIQDIADHLGNSLALAQHAMNCGRQRAWSTRRSASDG